MCNICVFAGTTEGRELVEFLAGQPVQATVCVATEYGETLLPEAENITVLAGRIPVEDIIRMLQRMRFDLVIDATHPYATSITESICTACRETETEYLRLLRQSSEQTEDVVCLENAAAAAVRNWRRIAASPILPSGYTPGCCPWMPRWRPAAQRV